MHAAMQPTIVIRDQHDQVQQKGHAAPLSCGHCGQYPTHLPTCSIYFAGMCSIMEGNPPLLQQASAQKPIAASGTLGFKRTFCLHDVSGMGLMSNAASAYVG